MSLTSATQVVHFVIGLCNCAASTQNNDWPGIINHDVVHWQYGPDALNEGHNVGPGYVPDIGKSVIACGEADVADKDSIEMPSRDRRGKHVIHAYQRYDISTLQISAQSIPGS